MKPKVFSISLTVILIMTVAHMSAQERLNERGILPIYITPPIFPATEVVVHGQEAASINEYLFQHVEYPLATAQKHYMGTEVVRFKVSAEGELSSYEVINSVSPEIDEEVIRILATTSGNWIPGTINGIPSAQTREVSMVFKPHPKYDLVRDAREYQDKGNRMMFIKDHPGRAIKYYNRAVKLLPYEESILAARCLCRYEMGDQKGALEDLDRIIALNPEIKERFKNASQDEYFSRLKTEVEQDFISAR